MLKSVQPQEENHANAQTIETKSHRIEYIHHKKKIWTKIRLADLHFKAHRLILISREKLINYYTQDPQLSGSFSLLHMSKFYTNSYFTWFNKDFLKMEWFYGKNPLKLCCLNSIVRSFISPYFTIFFFFSNLQPIRFYCRICLYDL